MVDVLAIGAHPDDVEVGIGGVVAKLVAQGYSVGILDLTRGEMASRGSVEERAQESREAAEILGVVERECAKLPDGRLANTTDQQQTLIPLLRSLRPRIILAPMENDRHPDHNAAYSLVRDANYFAGLAKLDPDAVREPHRAPDLYFYRVYGDPTMPQLVVDISDHFEQKMRAVQAYKSQFFNPSYSGRPTYVASEEFWDYTRLRAAYWGRRIGVAHGEPVYLAYPLGVAGLPGLESGL